MTNLTSCLRMLALEQVRATGATIVRAPNARQKQVFLLTRNGVTTRVALKTSIDAYVAFVPQEGGGWDTLEDVDAVLVASMDLAQLHQGINIGLVPANEYLAAFNAERNRRERDGLAVSMTGVGMWVYVNAKIDGVSLWDRAEKLARNMPLSVELKRLADAKIAQRNIVVVPVQANVVRPLADWRMEIANHYRVEPFRVMLNVDFS